LTETGGDDAAINVFTRNGAQSGIFGAARSTAPQPIPDRIRAARRI
jgi:hypothetical protein